MLFLYYSLIILAYPAMNFKHGTPAKRIHGYYRTYILRKHTAWRCHMRDDLEKRAQELAVFVIENRTTIRAAAQKFGISKSTVHKDLSERLETINRPLYQQVKEVLECNKAERHIRGGMATRRKYKGL